MIKDILIEKNLSVYKVSKETGIAYTTLNDIVIEKTDIRKSSAELLYRLSKYFCIPMETLYEACINKCASNSYGPCVGIWWWTGDRIIGEKVSKDKGENIDGLIHYSHIENHVTLWKKVLKDNFSDKEYKEQYDKGFKSLYRGRVYYNPRTACYEITCSKCIVDNVDFREKVIKFHNLSNERKEFVILHHYENLRELTGNAAVDADYYESSY